ncbi:MAG: hypothetical protein ACYCOR_07000 [Acidobacteriaceae bacterium]
MKTLFTLVLLLGSSLAWAVPNPAAYTVSIHVVSSQIDTAYWGGTVMLYQTLHVLIDGKKYTLRGNPIRFSHTIGVLAPGEYKAKLVTDKHKGTYAYARVYELLFPDQTMSKLTVIGASE